MIYHTLSLPWFFFIMGARFSYLGRRIGRKVYIFASCNQEVADIRVCGPLRHNFHQDPRISQWLLTKYYLKNEEVIVFLSLHLCIM